MVGSRILGRTGLSVSEIGHGLWGMGSWSGSDDADSYSALRASADEGCTFFDTAWAYGDGHSDALLGKLLSDHQGGGLVAASKVPPANMKFPADPSDRYADVFPPGYVFESAERIRSALGVRSIPLLQLHVWDDSWANAPEFAVTVKDLKSKGIIEHFGISLNRWEPWNGIRAVEAGLVDTVQVIYNIFDQAPEDRLFPACREHGVGVIARVPLDEGSLGGKLTMETRFPASDWRARYFGPENLPETIRRVEALKATLPKGMSLPEMAVRFVLSNQDVASVIIGMRSGAHVQENLACSAKGPLAGDLTMTLKQHRWDREVTPWAN